MSLYSYASPKISVSVKDGGVFGYKTVKINGSLEGARNKAKLGLFKQCFDDGGISNVRYSDESCKQEIQSHRDIKVLVCKVKASTSCNIANSDSMSAIGIDGRVYSYKEIVENGTIKRSYGKAVAQLVKECSVSGQELDLNSITETVSYCTQEVQGPSNKKVQVCKTALQGACK